MRTVTVVVPALIFVVASGCGEVSGPNAADAGRDDAQSQGPIDAAPTDGAAPDAMAADAQAADAAISVCEYVPTTATATNLLSYLFAGGSFQSYGCAPIDPTFWLAGSGNSATITFVATQANPSFRVWGMNTDDTASVQVNGASYPLTLSSASYADKVVCGLSPGPDGVLFADGNLIGANSPSLGNYSYQDVTLNTTGVTSITITGLTGAGWGIAGATACTNGGVD